MIVGVDISTVRVDLAWLEHESTTVEHMRHWHIRLGDGEIVDRVTACRIDWPADEDGTPGADLQEVAIEYPFSNNRKTLAHLAAIMGAVTKQAPFWTRVAWVSALDLRTAIGAKNSKVSARDTLQAQGWSVDAWDEHELDAAVAALGWTAILEAQDAA